jgi:hypothetical protein
MKEKLRVENEELKTIRQQLKAFLTQQQQNRQPSGTAQAPGSAHTPSRQVADPCLADTQLAALKLDDALLEEAREKAVKLERDEIRLKHDQEKIVTQILAFNRESMVPVQQVSCFVRLLFFHPVPAH